MAGFRNQVCDFGHSLQKPVFLKLQLRVLPLHVRWPLVSMRAKATAHLATRTTGPR